jgi:hypothetical protein
MCNVLKLQIYGCSHFATSGKVNRRIDQNILIQLKQIYGKS